MSQAEVQYYSVNSTALEILRDRDLTGSRAVITGCTAGVGLEILKALAFTGCHVIMAIRDLQKGKVVYDTLTAERVNVFLVYTHTCI